MAKKQNPNQPPGQKLYKFIVAYTVDGSSSEFYAYPSHYGVTEHDARRIVVNNYLRWGRWVARIRLDTVDDVS